MNFSGFLGRRSGKASSSLELQGELHEKRKAANKELLAVDLFCHLTYLAAVASSRLPRHVLFDYAASLPLTSARYFKSVNFLTQRLSYDFPEACRKVGDATPESEPKAVFLRMANSLASGEEESEFLIREAKAMGQTYADYYERTIDNLKKWTDAYTALILSGSLIVVVCVVSMLIFPMSASLVTLLTLIMLMSVLLGGWLLYRTSPKEIKTHSLQYKSAEQRIAGYLFKFAIPLAFVILVFLLFVFKANAGFSMIVAAALMVPVGFIMVLDDRNIDKRDNDIAGFLRTLGGVSKAIGTTVTEALGRLDFNALHSLKKGVQKLNASLRFGVSPALCWLKFVGETGSESINRSVRIFYDGISLGGDPEVVGSQCSNFAMRVAMLRAKRNMVASGFSYLCIIMHGTIVLLLVGIYQIMVMFSQAMQNIGGAETGGMEALSGLPAFQMAYQSGMLNTLNIMTMIMIMVLTIVNAVAIKVVEGGHNYKFLFYVGITLGLSGACLLFVPGMIAGMFSSVATIGP